MKKKIVMIIGAVAVVAAIVCAIAFVPSEYETDAGDTEELYRSNIEKIGYENTIETAIPQTELYNLSLIHI